MLRNRLIFSLIYADGFFMQSRNFRLQRVGDINWLERNYNFRNIAFSLDELLIFNASRKEKNIDEFSKIVRRLAGSVFLPMAAGGGIESLAHVEQLFKNGADKVTLNTMLIRDPEMVQKISSTYGAQSIVAVVDYRTIDGEAVAFIGNGNEQVSNCFDEHLRRIQSLGVGEIMLNSIDKDGTGFGYDLTTIEKYQKECDVPLIISGGAGNEKHLDEGIQFQGVSAVSTANLFNFIGNGLPNARRYLIENERNFAKW